MLSFEPKLDAVEGEHARDGEMAAELTEKRDILELIEPVGVVDHLGVGGAVAERHELSEYPLDPFHIAGDVGIAEELTGLVLPGRIADLGGAATHEHDGSVPGPLEDPQHHDRQEAAHVQARRRAVEPDIARDDAFAGTSIEAIRVRDLMHVAALREGSEEV